LFHAEVKRTDLIPTATRLLGEARAAGVKTGTFQPGYPDLVPNIPLLSQVAQYGCLVDGTAAAAIIDEVAPHRDDVILTHHRVSGFHGTDLDVVLRGTGIDTVIVAGVATNMAVESTARTSADLGYRTLVVADACSPTSETAHNASLASMAMLGGVVTTDDLLATLRARPRLLMPTQIDCDTGRAANWAADARPFWRLSRCLQL
jgi:nicotinamidase-related amidase